MQPSIFVTFTVKLVLGFFSSSIYGASAGTTWLNSNEPSLPFTSTRMVFPGSAGCTLIVVNEVPFRLKGELEVDIDSRL